MTNANLDLDATLRSAYEAFGRSDFVSADAACETVLAGAPDSPEGWRLRARLRLVREDLPGAIEALETGARRARDTLPIVEDLAELRLRAGDARAAGELAAELRRRAGDLVKYVNLSARAGWRQGEYVTSLAEFELAARHAPDVAAVQLGLAKAYLHLGRRADGRRVITDLLARQTDGEALALLAHCDFDPARPVASRAAFEAALSANSRDASARLGAAMLRMLDGDTAGADALASDFTEAGLKARWEGFIALRAAGCQRFVGLPLDVLVEGLAAARAPGYAAEFGVFTGRSLRMIAAALPADVHGFDSFQGLPGDWTPNTPAGTYTTHGRAPHDLPAHVTLHTGPFNATLPAFAERAGKARFWHVDCDLHASTLTVLDALGDTLQVGSVIVFDDLVGYPGWREHEWKAWEDFSRSHGVGYRWVGAALGAREAAVEIVRL